VQVLDLTNVKAVAGGWLHSLLLQGAYGIDLNAHVIHVRVTVALADSPVSVRLFSMSPIRDIFTHSR
jgi:hypothetical protein